MSVHLYMHEISIKINGSSKFVPGFNLVKYRMKTLGEWRYDSTRSSI